MLINEYTGKVIMDESGYTIILAMINGCIRANDKINNVTQIIPENVEYCRLMCSGRLKILQVIFLKALLRV